MFEPYRTLLGHLRHESGHFFWDVLIKDSAWLPRFRALFGDERQDYAQALQAHYARGPQALMAGSNSTSAPMRQPTPWEDWAETWAHYLPTMDLVRNCRQLPGAVTSSGHLASWPPMEDPFTPIHTPFEHILQQCVPSP